ncbi:hypothetical protein SAMN06298221_107166 [Sphaerochaeta associata]|uniref:AbiTii domain-containing protein n=1 Tax=Sphaerochaeta associata TaxID=1129264 RepID=A0ABY4DDP1_9SPIR|nr:hypothetical protein [Sphaerochaeta associata]UOM50061.1 hypothetical protein MUG09_10895 [Sphaerochaeta associata]SMP54404.1 hypothetical protein SAMN06298221_107166 [Sphaerochaeta associata]
MDNKGIVLELQREALDNSSDIVGLLRKAKIIAYKLGLEDLTEWATKEVGGYTSTDLAETIPRYRHISGGTIEFFNPYRGYCPTYIDDAELLKRLDSCIIYLGIPKITSYLKTEKSSIFRYTFTPDAQKILNSISTTPCDFSYSVKYPVNCLFQILEDARNVIIDWTLLLESNGILGIDFSFSDKEIGIAASKKSIVNYYTTNVFLNSSNFQIQQNSTEAKQVLSISDLSK